MIPRFCACLVGNRSRDQMVRSGAFLSGPWEPNSRHGLADPCTDLLAMASSCRHSADVSPALAAVLGDESTAFVLSHLCYGAISLFHTSLGGVISAAMKNGSPNQRGCCLGCWPTPDTDPGPGLENAREIVRAVCLGRHASRTGPSKWSSSRPMASTPHRNCICHT
jgi:hypothetical protein